MSTTTHLDERRANCYCVIGAGASGLAVIKTLLDMGIPCECLEQNGDVGGIWDYGTSHSSVYQSAHLISSKRFTELSGFPMPDGYPAYPSRVQVLEYLRAYAQNFDLGRVIEFGRAVESVALTPSYVTVSVRGEESPRRYRGVIVSNGHLWKPLTPDIPGQFTGQLLHAREYKTPELLVGQRVLVVGAGNSGCDIAVEASRNAARTFHSMRRGRYFVPKFLFGKAIDAGSDWLYRWRMPLWVHRLFATLPLSVAIGAPQDYGLPKPDHRFLDEPPVPNSDLPHAVAHGRVTIRPDVERYEGQRVLFVDGTEETIDVIVMATGYEVAFPFLDSELVPQQAGVPHLYLNMFHPVYDNLMFAGLFDASTKTWELVERQAAVMATFIKANSETNASLDWFRTLRASPLSPRFRANPTLKEYLYLEYFWYRRQLTKLSKRIKNSMSS